MDYILESGDIKDYLKTDKYIDFDNELIKQKAGELYGGIDGETAKIEAAYKFVRDNIRHSGDIDSDRVTKRASEALKFGEGICIAKALLLAALLRCGGIPAGLCYQRLTRGDTPDTGYVIHGLNAVYLSCEQKWIRLDARGNKPNVDAQFSTSEERLAFPVRTEYDEVDYPNIYATPHPAVMEAMEKYINRREYKYDISEL
jgi:transglutaminase-like putative cysteine protease